ncbi:MAG: helix-turn-helix domain-containing protein [Cyanothece sp. SIO1E1]|nr:helix-turn-helix domain-containing protein [Cyanothece sp. SIO1E1]
MSKLDLTQTEQLKEIGTYLGQLRQEQSISLEEIATKTYIPLRLLKAIEAGQTDPLPEPVFIQGFIRRFGDSLGLDGRALSNQFSVNLAAAIPPEILKSKDPEAEQFNHSQSAESQSAVDASPRVLPTAKPFYAPYIVVGIVALVGTVFLFSLSGKQESKQSVANPQETESVAAPPTSTSETSLEAEPAPDQSSSVPEASEPVVASPPPTNLEVPANTEVPPATAPQPEATTTAPEGTAPANGNAPIAVDMELTAASWLRITVDGKTEFEGTLQPGTQQRLTAQKSLTIRAGNAGGVYLAPAGEELQAIGEPGSIRDVSFSSPEPQSP